MRAAFVLRDRSDSELLAGIREAVARECEDLALVVAHLAEMDRRELFKSEGCSSLFKYCVEVLHLSESQTYLRIDVARVAQKYPVVLDMLAEGRVQLSAVHRLGPSLTEENHIEVLEEAVHKKKDDVEEIVARLRPKPPVPATIRKLPGTGSTAESEEKSAGLFAEGPADPKNGAGPARTEPAGITTSRKPSVSPLAPEIYKLEITIDSNRRKKLKQLQEMMRHRIPNGDLGEIMAMGIDLLWEEVSRDKFAKTDRPRKKNGRGRQQGTESNDDQPESRHIPAEVQRQVWERDDGQCAFVSKNGRRCSERDRIEYHHVVPFAWGGQSTLENIQLRCRTHNAYEGELLFGRVLKRTGRQLFAEDAPTGSGTSSSPGGGT